MSNNDQLCAAPDGKNMSGAIATDLEDKIESSTTVDSGFISGPIASSRTFDDDYEDQQQQQRDIKHKEESVPMRLESGIFVDNLGLSEQFSSLSLKNPKLNNFDNCCAPTIQEPVADCSWEKFYDQDLNGDTCLHTAITALPEAVYTLIRMAPHQSFLDTRNDEGQSALHYAVLTKQPNLVRMLIVAGALPYTQNMCGDSPLHLAASQGDLLCCRAITEDVSEEELRQMDLAYVPKRSSCKLDQWNYDGQTCLHLAAYYGHVEVLRHLVRHGADVNAREGKAGYTALHMAIEQGNEQLVHFLLSDCTALDVETVTYGGRSALQLGLPLDRRLVEILEARGVDPYETSDESDSDEEVLQTNTTNLNLIDASA